MVHRECLRAAYDVVVGDDVAGLIEDDPRAQPAPILDLHDRRRDRGHDFHERALQREALPFRWANGRLRRCLLGCARDRDDATASADHRRDNGCERAGEPQSRTKHSSLLRAFD